MQLCYFTEYICFELPFLDLSIVIINIGECKVSQGSQTHWRVFSSLLDVEKVSRYIITLIFSKKIIESSHFLNFRMYSFVVSKESQHVNPQIKFLSDETSIANCTPGLLLLYLSSYVASSDAKING